MLPPIRSSPNQNQEQDERVRVSVVELAGRSSSVPPLLEGRKGHGGSREYKEYEDVHLHSAPEHHADIDFSAGAENQKREEAIFGTGGTLSASDDDPTTLILSIDGRKVEFQLSLVDGEAEDEIRNNSLKRPAGRDEMEVARLFDSSRVDLTKLLDDDNVIKDSRLMIRWARDQCVALPLSSQQLILCDDRYITRDDGSPLMDALVYWRASTLKKRVSDGLLQLTSPRPSSITTQRYQQREPILDQQAHIRSQSEPPCAAEVQKAEEENKIKAMTTGRRKENGAVSLGTDSMGSAKKPTSSSWVQWWSRSRKKDLGVTNVKDTTESVEDVNGVLDTVRLSLLIRSF